MPVTKAGMQISLDRNMPAMQDNGYTGGFEELLAQLSPCGGGRSPCRTA